MQLKLSTWQEVDAYLQRSRGIIVPIGSTEQHGPNGLIGTDCICPETVALAVAEQIDVLIAPTINYGMAQHHLGFAGTVSLRPSTLLALVCDVVDSLALHGFERIYFLNGHGGNVATVNAAFSEIYAHQSLKPITGRQLRMKISNWWQSPGVLQLSKQLYGKAEGRHATPSEVSLSYFAHPSAVKQVAMSPDVAPLGEIHDAVDFRAHFPDGRIGSNPALASVEAGQQILQAAARDTLEDYQAFITQEVSR